MNSVLKWTGVVTAVVLVAAVPARASVTEALSDTAAFSVPSSGGWTVQMSNCSYTNNGAVGDCGSENVVASVTGSMLSLVFEGTNGPSLNAFLYNPGNNNASDLSLNLIVTAPSGQAIYLATNAISGSTLGSSTLVSNGETFTHPPESEIIANLSTTLASETFAPVSAPLSVGNDWVTGLGLKAGTITTATLTFNAPEPVSSSLLVVGLAGLGFARRKARRLR